MRDKFTNPANGETYEFDIGHSSEEPSSKSRQITNSANTANTGLIAQQGDVQPMTLKYNGTILKASQHKEMWRWYQLCDTQTIFFTDYAGNEYEVTITDFAPKRQSTIRNPRDPVNAPLHYWNYTISMQIIRVIKGELEGLAP
jgi:hypothetical protein